MLSAAVPAYGSVIIGAAAFIGATVVPSFREFGVGVQCAARLTRCLASARLAPPQQAMTAELDNEQMTITGLGSLSVSINEVSTCGA